MNTRWALYLALFFVTISSVHAATLFESNWSTATGNDINTALLDGGIWNNYFCSGIADVLTVVEGNTVSWSGTPNVLRVMDAGTRCGMLAREPGLPLSTSHYGRFFFRNDVPESTNNHFATYHAVGRIQLAHWNRQGFAEGFEVFMRIYYQSDGQDNGYPISRWAIAELLDHQQWYRYEWHMEYVTPTTYRIWPRIYDAQNNLLYDAYDYRQGDYGAAQWNGRNDWTLGSYYDAGYTFGFGDVNLARNIGFGQEGSMRSTNSGEYFYLAALKYDDSDWIGGIDSVSEPPADTTLFESNWSYATGNDINTALLDGGIWDFWTCWGGIDQVMEVIPGNTVGWTATPNVMQFTQRGPSYCGSIQTQSSIPQLTDFYARMYIRTDEESGGWHDVTLNCCGSIQAALWSRGNYNSTHYRAKVAPEYSSTTYPYNLWFADPIPKYEWHRWEWYVDYVNSTNARIYTRVYDMDGNLLIDENSIRNVDTFQTTLAEWYAAGNTIPVRDADLFRRFGTSNPGQGGSPDTGLHWYNAGVKVVSEPVDPANNIWVGPIDGQSSSGPNIVWESDWSAALGTSEAALTDGGKWDGTGTDQGLLSVTTKPSGAPASWPENAMYVINDGGYQWSYISGGQWTMPAQGEYMFVRHLLYVDEGFNSWSGGSKPLQNAPGAISWIWPNPTGSGSLRFFGSGVAYFLPEYTMSTQTPYRAEIRLYNVPGSDLTYQIAVRWYDESTGMLIATEEDLLDNWGEGPGTLADHGPFTSTQSAEELWQNLRLGATSTTGANSRYWHTGIAVGISANADDWIGPYGETSTPPDNPPQDTTPPVATITAPSGGATLPEGTTSTTLSVSTNEPATCRYSTSDEAYVAMPNTLSGTGTTSHSDTLTGLTSGGFTYYVRCQDTTGNAMSSSTSVSFSVAQPQVSYDGDANSDGRVNIQDILLIVSNLGRTSFDARADRNSDGDVNVFDLVLVAKHFGREYEMTDQRLIAHYTFNEGSGSTVNDQSNNNHHGTIQGTPNWVTGVSGSALQLDGTTNYIAVPHSSGLSMTNEITLMAWVNTPGDDYDNIIVKGALGSAYGLFLYNLGIEHNLGAYTQTGELIPANTWTHIALTYDGSAIRVYRDGAQVSSTPRTGLLGTNTQTLHIGAATGSSPFAGMIDEVRLYNTALSQAEIQSIMSE